MDQTQGRPIVREISATRGRRSRTHRRDHTPEIIGAVAAFLFGIAVLAMLLRQQATSPPISARSRPSSSNAQRQASVPRRRKAPDAQRLSGAKFEEHEAPGAETLVPAPRSEIAPASAKPEDTSATSATGTPPDSVRFEDTESARTWRLLEGAEEFSAEFIKLRDGKISLRRVDTGERMEVPVESLSNDDLYWLSDNLVPERFPAPVLHFQKKLVTFRLNLCNPPDEVEVRIVGTGVGESGPMIPQNETITYELAANAGLLLINQAQVLPVILACSLRNSKNFPDTLVVEPEIRVTGKRIPFTPDEVLVAMQKISGSIAKKQSRLADQKKKRANASSDAAGFASSMNYVDDIFDLANNAAATRGAAQQMTAATASATAASSLAGKIASISWKDDVLVWASGFFEQAQQGAYLELDVIHRIRGIDYVAAIYRRDAVSEGGKVRPARDELPEFGQDMPYPVDDGEPGRDSTQFAVARREPERLEGKALRWQGAYLVGLEQDPNWGRAYFLVRFADPKLFLSPLEGADAFYLVVSNAFAAEIEAAQLGGRRLAVSFRVRRDPHRDNGHIGHVFEVTYFENGNRRVLRSK